MAATNYILFLVVVVILSFVENAPGSIVRTDLKDFESRLVFIDRDDDNDGVNSKTSLTAHAPTPLYQTRKSELPRIKLFGKSVSIKSIPSLAVKGPATSELSEMDDRRIWGIAEENKALVEDESFYNRPLVIPKIVVKVPNPTKTNVDTEVLQETNAPKPSLCDISIVICCENPSKLKECIRSRGCYDVTENMFSNLCNKDSIYRILEVIRGNV